MEGIFHTVRETSSELWSDGTGWILIAVSAGWFVSIGMRFVYPTLAPFFADEFQITLATTGILLTALWAAYAIGHIPGGVLGDRFGEGNTLVLSTAISAVTILVVVAATNVWMLFAGTIVFGLATALYGPTRITIFTDIYAHRAGTAVGLTMAAGSAGNTVLPVVATFVATYATWRLGFGMFVPLFLGFTVLLWLFVPASTSDRSSDRPVFSSRTVARIWNGIRSGGTPTIVGAQVCLSFVYQGFTAFYPTYLVVTKELSPAVAATLFGLFFATGAVIQPISGTVLDRFGVRLTLVGFCLGCVSALWLLPVVSGTIVLVGITILISCLNGCFVVTQTYIADTLPSEIQGTGFGTLKASWILVGASSPLLLGALAEYGYFNEAFVLLATIAGVGLVLAATRL